MYVTTNSHKNLHAHFRNLQKMRKVAERFAQKLQEVVPGSRQSPGGEEAEWGKFGASVRDVRIGEMTLICFLFFY